MDLKGLLGEELHSQVMEKIGDTKIDIIKDKYVPIHRMNEVQETAKKEKEQLQKQLDETSKTLESIKGEAGASDELKKRIEALEAEKKKIEEDGKAKLTEIKFETDLEKELVKQGAKNVVAVRALLPDVESLKDSRDFSADVKDQIDKLKADESTSFMFGEIRLKGKQTPPADPRNPDPKQKQPKTPMEALKMTYEASK